MFLHLFKCVVLRKCLSFTHSTTRSRVGLGHGPVLLGPQQWLHVGPGRRLDMRPGPWTSLLPWGSVSAWPRPGLGGQAVCVASSSHARSWCGGSAGPPCECPDLILNLASSFRATRRTMGKDEELETPVMMQALAVPRELEVNKDACRDGCFSLLSISL